MLLPFVKMHGAGNDYLYVDGFQHRVEGPEELARRICERRTGVGADGLILIQPSERTDARMAMYNADGSRSAMCGNGLRCVGKFLFDRGRAGRLLSIATDAGLFPVEVLEEDAEGRACLLRVELPEPSFERSEVPMRGPEGEVLDEEFVVGGECLRIAAAGLGNPHCVVFLDSLEGLAIEKLGTLIQNDPRFPQGVNVEFVVARGPGQLRQRTWERGSGETSACGSGAVVAAVAAMRTLGMGPEVKVELQGGTLEVSWTGRGQPASLIGPAVEVFRGTFDY